MLRRIRVLFLCSCSFILLYFQQLFFNGKSITPTVRNTPPLNVTSQPNIYNLSEDTFSLNQFRNLMQSRIQHIRNVCEADYRSPGETLSSIASLGLPDYRKVEGTQEARLLLLDKERIIWCPVPKAASSSWKYNLLHFRLVLSKHSFKHLYDTELHLVSTFNFH